jgi:hypothetical protein
MRLPMMLLCVADVLLMCGRSAHAQMRRVWLLCGTNVVSVEHGTMCICIRKDLKKYCHSLCRSQEIKRKLRTPRKRAPGTWQFLLARRLCLCLHQRARPATRAACRGPGPVQMHLSSAPDTGTARWPRLRDSTALPHVPFTHVIILHSRPICTSHGHSPVGAH